MCSLNAETTATVTDVANWMLRQVMGASELPRKDAARHIAREFGPEFVIGTQISKQVRWEFRKLHRGTIVFDIVSKAWKRA